MIQKILNRILFLCVIFSISSLLFDFGLFGTAWADTPTDSIEEIVPINDNVDDTNQPVLYKEIPIYTSLKRLFYWRFIEKGKGNFDSYKEFKQCWDPNTKIWIDVKNSIKSFVSPSDSQMYDDHLRSKERYKQTMYDKQERVRRSYMYRQAQDNQLFREEKERMERYYTRFGKKNK